MTQAHQWTVIDGTDPSTPDAESARLSIRPISISLPSLTWTGAASSSGGTEPFEASFPFRRHDDEYRWTKPVGTRDLAPTELLSAMSVRRWA